MSSIYMGMDTGKQYQKKLDSGQVGYMNAVGPDAYYITEYMNNLNEASAEKQMAFQKSMSDTAHQREVKDLIAAGLNPMMSLNNGASTPGGAGFSADSSGVQMKLNQQQMKNQRKITSMQNANAMKINNKSLKVQEALGRYSADLSYAASIFGAQQSANAQKYYADVMAGASEYGAMMNYLGTQYSADQLLAGTQYKSNKDFKLGKKQIKSNKDIADAKNQNALDVANLLAQAQVVGGLTSGVVGALPGVFNLVRGFSK